MLPICLLLVSISSIKPHGQQFLVGAHHQSVKQSPFAIQSLCKTLKNKPQGLWLLWLWKRALIVSHATYMINPRSVHVKRQPRTVALWRNRLDCRLPLRDFWREIAPFQDVIWPQGKNELEVVILWMRTVEKKFQSFNGLACVHAFTISFSRQSTCNIVDTGSSWVVLWESKGLIWFSFQAEVWKRFICSAAPSLKWTPERG